MKCHFDSCYLRVSLSSAVLQEQTHDHHIANTFICCVLQRRAPARNRGVTTVSTVHSREQAAPHWGNNELVRRHSQPLVCSLPRLKGEGDATAQRLVKLSAFIPLALSLSLSLSVRLSSGSKINY